MQMQYVVDAVFQQGVPDGRRGFAEEFLVDA
jgi:hypothetical protein